VTREGTELGGKYRLGRAIGEGGMGEVYRAENYLIGRPVAIKVMRAELARDEALVKRFLREARAANMVRHPNVVDILDIGQDETGTPFIVAELLEGEDLAKALTAAGGRFAIEPMLRYMLPIVEAVAEGHTKGLVHRDLKPENVFLAREGRNMVPKLLDFGISHLKPGPLDKRLTAAGQAMGTPAYMSPEQIRGVEVDARADVWSLGVILQELLSGQLPFDAENAPALFVAVVSEEPRPLADDGSRGRAEIAAIVRRCLRRDPDERYPTAVELLKDLRRTWRSLNVGRYSHALPSDPPGSPSAAPPPLAVPSQGPVPEPADKLPAVPDLALPQRASAPVAQAIPPPPPRRAVIELASSRPPPVRIASAPRPDPDAPTAEDVQEVHRAIAWVWLAGSVLAGAALGRFAPTEILAGAAASLSEINPSAPSMVTLLLLALCGGACWRALRAFRDGERSVGIGMGALAGAGLLLSVQISL
jgi:serine/threonine-protein kinase